MVLYFNVLMEKKMKKVCFVFAVFAAIFLLIGCDGNMKDSLGDILDGETTDADVADSDATDTADSDKTDSDATDTVDSDATDTADSDATDTVDTDATDTADTDATDTADTDATDTVDTDATDTADSDSESGENNDNESGENNDNDSGENNDNDSTEPETTPCNPNQCLDIANSNGVCTLEGESFSCGCHEDYTWKEGECRAIDACHPNPCLGDTHSDGVCTLELEEDSYSCGCESDLLGDYMWYNGECRLVMTPDQCREFALWLGSQLGGIPDYVTDLVTWVCHCFTDECVLIVDL